MKNSAAKNINLGNQDKIVDPWEQWNRRILVVDDEKEIAASYVDFLGPKDSNNVIAIKSSRGAQVNSDSETNADLAFEVDTAHCPNEALEMVRKAVQEGKPYAMGFFDVRLDADIDGFDLVKEVFEIDPKMAAVFVTAYNDRSVDSIDKFLGGEHRYRWDYLNKPFTSSEIVQKARSQITMWNLKVENAQKNYQISKMNKSLLEVERMSSVAAISRSVGHEFGNFLMQIMGKADIGLGKDLVGKQDCLEKILISSQRAAEVLDRFKRIGEPASEVTSKTKVSILQLVKETIDLLEHQFADNTIKTCIIKRDQGWVVGNHTSLIQVLVNLTINAVHAMPDSGQLDYSITNKSDHVELIIRDYGKGIKPDLLEKVLEPMFTTKGDKGTGLGLSICKEIIEISHRGDFIMRNHPMRGLEVVIKIPVSEDSNGKN